MQEFQILDEKRYPIQPVIGGDYLPYWRYEHRATIGYGFKTFLVLVDNLKGNIHIEENTAGGLVVVEDTELHLALTTFAQEKEFLNVLPPLLKGTIT